MRNTRPRRRTTVPRVDQLESRELLSTTAMPVRGAVLAHHHEALRLHHAAVVERAHSGHHGAPAGATPAAVTGLHVVPSPTVANAALNGTVAIADNDIWATGFAGLGTTTSPFVTLAEHFNGTSWSVVPTPALSGGEQFDAVAAVASNDVWAVGVHYPTTTTSDPLIEHWNGTSWSVVASPTLPNGAYLSAVTAVSSTNVWAVGTSGNLKGDLVEHWNGTSWSVVSSPAFNGATDLLRGVSADASNDVWAVGDDFGVGTVILHFNGMSWSRMATPEDAGLNGVTVLSPTDVWAVGIATGHGRGPRPFIENFNGTSWSFVSSPNPTGGSTSLLGIAAVSANDIWAVGSVGIQNWNGTSWSEVSSPSLAVAVTALSDGTVVAVDGGTILEN